MNAVNRISNRIVNALVIAMLVLVGITAIMSMPVIQTGEIDDLSNLTETTGEETLTIDTPAAGTRGINGDGNDYVEIHTDGNGVPQIQIDNALHGVNTIFIGEPNVRLDIPIRSLKVMNSNNTDGDDILYNVSLSIDESATTYYNSNTMSWIDASSYITWDTQTIAPNYLENGVNNGNCILRDGIPGDIKYIPWFYNDYGSPGHLDRNNNQRGNNDEYYAIYDDFKLFEGFRFDVDGNAPPGTYNLSVEVT